MQSNSLNKQVKVRRTKEQWQEILLAYEDSGLSQEAFCTQQSLATSTFHKWRQRLAADKSHDQAIPEFIELTPAQSSNSDDWDIELSLSSTIVLRIRQMN